MLSLLKRLLEDFLIENMLEFNKLSYSISWKKIVYVFLFLVLFFLSASRLHSENIGAGNSFKLKRNPVDVSSKLNDILVNVEKKQKEADEKSLLLKKAKTDQEKESIKEAIDRINNAISIEKTSFEMIVTAGTELDADESMESQEFDWQKDLLDIIQPFVKELHQFTENKRKLDVLHNKITFYQAQIEKINKALLHLSQFNPQGLNSSAMGELNNIKDTWENYLEENTHLYEVAKLQRDEMMHSKKVNNLSWIDKFDEFASGRGATLFIAIFAFVGVYSAMLILLKISSWITIRFKKTKSSRTYYQRVFKLLYHFLMAIMALSAFFYVLDLRDDPFLIAISLIIVISVIWFLKNSIPTYIEEIRLLLNTGSAREGECIIYNSVPMVIEEINYYTQLRNPVLPELKLRLPLSELLKYVSRPITDDSPLFPCQKGDFVMLYGDIYGIVKHVNLETIVLSLPDGTMPITYTIDDFYSANPRNFSLGFTIHSEFGIDYAHQSLSTKEIPSCLQEQIEKGLLSEAYGDYLKELKVEFGKASTSFLIYQVTCYLEGGGASYYFQIFRDIQRYSVEACQKNNWAIVPLENT